MDKERHQKVNEHGNKRRDNQSGLNAERMQMGYPLPEHLYQDLLKHPLYYPPYPTPPKNYPHLDSQAQMSQYPISQMSREASSLYQMPMQQPYPYGYPCSSYPGMPYPYGMYPPYYNYRPPAELYPDPQHFGYPYRPPPNAVQPEPKQYSVFQQKSPVGLVKEQIVISSDEERNRYCSNKFIGAILKQQPQKQQPQKAAAGDIPLAKEEHFLNQEQAEANPFYIKHKKIAKEDKNHLSKPESKERKTYKEKNEEKTLAREARHLKKRQERGKQKQAQNITNTKGAQGKQTVAPKVDSKHARAEQKSLPELTDNRKEASQVQERESKKEKSKDDHPLKELRYSQSHGRIRIGVYFQSAMPDLVDPRGILLMRKQFQTRLQERQISALTF